MDNTWSGAALIFDIWDHFEGCVIDTAEQLSAGQAAEFWSTESSGVTLTVVVTKPAGGPGYSVMVESPNPYRDYSDGLSEQGWSLRAAGDHASVPGLCIERSCAEPSDVAATLLTTLRGSLGMRNPWFMGLAPDDYSTFANSDELDVPFDPHSPLGPMDLQMSVGMSLFKGYGTFPPMMVDGVFRVRSRTSDLFIRTEQEFDEVGFSWVVNCDAQGRRAAKLLARRLNEQSSLAHFSVDDDGVRARYTLPAAPLVPSHLYQVINSVGQGIASVLDATGDTDKAAAETRL